MADRSQPVTWHHDAIDFIGAWRPAPGDSRGTIAVIHGLGEYSIRYEPFVEAWHERCFDVFTFDARGHGKTSGARGDAESVDTLVEDAALALRVMDPLRASDTPLYVYGHSLGGLVTLRLALLHPDLATTVDAFAVSAPAISAVQEQRWWKVKFGRLIRPILPRLGMPNGIRPTDLSSDAARVPRYGEDRLLHRRISVRLGLSILDDGPALLNTRGKSNVPVLLMHGDDDHITSHDASRQLAAAWDGVEFRSWSGFRHELHNEVRRAEVFAFVADWFGRATHEQQVGNSR